MELKIENWPAYLAGFYPHLDPGALCFLRGQEDTDYLFWAGFPFRAPRPGCLVFLGKTKESEPLALSGMLGELGILLPSSYSLEEHLQARMEQGFEVIERPVSLKDLIRQNHVRFRYPTDRGIRAQLDAVLRDLRSRSFTTENLVKNAVWA
ncbi:hypothetical protein A5904_03405 [Acidithiobacillus caldus]|uniref:hypothetical protein n=2 Tax=Acidithiobacillus caldus TaxID=33059 RepID=UPI000CD35884|nr:hypothetical protein [Acidithiobacillus caldus]AUW32147.1 hypothetical protein A5904_03405 [Acidithiobacillus caldus]